MRKIKFRVWCKDSEQWVDDDTRFSIFKGEMELGDGNPWAYLQYTGLNDFNGKEIYEGDILSGIKLYGFNGVFNGDVRYVSCRFQCFVKYPEGGYGGVILDAEEVEEHELEIIGNIFENPEFLKN